MPNDSSPLFWFVLFVLVCLSIWAYGLWRLAWNKLNRQELVVIKFLKSRPAPQNWEEAENFLPLDSPSIAVATLRRALMTGRVQLDTLGFYDWIQIPRYLAGIFVFVGLLGTILGIAVSVSSLGAAVSNSTTASDQLSDISRHIFELLSGMRYAFYCTIGGLLSTLLVSALNAYYLSYCRQAETEIEALAYRIFVPMYVLKPSPGESVETVSEEISLSEIVSALRQSIDDLSRTTTQFSENIIPTAQSFEKSAAGTAQLSNTLLGAGTALREELKESSERIEAVRQTMDFAGNGIHETIQKFAEITSGLQGAATQLAGERTALVNTVKDATLEMAGSVRTLAETLIQGQKIQQDRMDELIDHSSTNQEKMGLLLRQFEITLSDVTAVAEQSTLRQDLQRLILQLQELQAQTNASNPQREMTTMRGDIAAIGKLVQSVNSQIGEVGSRTQRLDTSVGGFADQIIQVRRQVSEMEAQQNAPVAKRFPRIFQKDYWV